MNEFAPGCASHPVKPTVDPDALWAGGGAFSCSTFYNAEQMVREVVNINKKRQFIIRH
jgi:hypothetical protein